MFKNLFKKPTPPPQAIASLPLESKEEVPLSHLEQAMMNSIRKDTPESRKTVYQELIFSDLFLCLADTPSESSPDESINVAILKNSQDTSFCAAFTSEAAIRRWRPEGGHFISVRGQDIFKMLEKSPSQVLVINPASAPFIILNKLDIKQLALGAIPAAPINPVHMATEGSQTAPAEPQVQVSFPPDAFTSEQKEIIKTYLLERSDIEAGALGALLPPNVTPEAGNEEASWIRALFVRIEARDINPQELQVLCTQMKTDITENHAIFKETQFEVGIMPDAKFWEELHKNNVVLIDKMAGQEGLEPPTS